MESLNYASMMPNTRRWTRELRDRPVPVDLVMAGMAPNISGESVVDQPRAMCSAELAAGFAGQVLRPGGDFVVIGVFYGDGSDACLRRLRDNCRKVVGREPGASHPRDRDVYLLARHREL